MVEFAIILVLGLAVVAMGIVTFSGNLMFLKSRNKRNVLPENQAVFARICGIAMIICGIGFVIFGICIRLFGEDSPTTLILIPFLVATGIITLYANLKYNKRS